MTDKSGWTLKALMELYGRARKGKAAKSTQTHRDRTKYQRGNKDTKRRVNEDSETDVQD